MSRGDNTLDFPYIPPKGQRLPVNAKVKFRLRKRKWDHDWQKYEEHWNDLWRFMEVHSGWSD